MDKNAIQEIFRYHFEFNRRLLEYSKENISADQFIQEFDYSHRSIRNLFVHILGVDNRWFSGLLGYEPPPFPNPVEFPTFSIVREEWQKVEHRMRDYLTNISDIELQQPFVEDMRKWQVLFHLVNHGTHHRAQIYSLLHRLNIKTLPQDYALYVMGRI